MSDTKHKQGSPFQVYFNQMVNIWQYMSDNNREITDELPDDIQDRLNDLSKDIDKLDTLQTEMYKELGINQIYDFKEFVINNNDSFDKNEFDFLMKLEKLKLEIGFFKDKLKDAVEHKVEELGGVTEKDRKIRKSRRKLKNVDRNI